VVCGHEPLGGGPRGGSQGPAKHGHHSQVRLESARSDGGLQRSDMDVEFLGQLVKRQRLVVSLVMGDRSAGTPQHRDGDDSSPAVVWPEGLERNRQERSELALSQADRSTQLAKLVHR
jgi:hypothetical protein